MNARSKVAISVAMLGTIVLASCAPTGGSSSKPPNTATSEQGNVESTESSQAGVTPTVATSTTTTQPEPESDLTPSQQNAARSANSYLEFSGFSRNGLIGQLSSEYGDQFSVGDATAAVDSLNVDWNLQAVKSAASYLKMSGFSCQGLIDQLSSDYGDKYTVAQATFGATQAGIC